MTSEQKRILIVDDEKELREAMMTALAYEGFETLAAGDGEEGYGLALKEKPDLIFLDIAMPKLDGLGFLDRLRQDEWGREAKVIVMTALDDMEKIATVVEKGGLEYIVKSTITLAGIVEKAKKYLGVL